MRLQPILVLASAISTTFAGFLVAVAGASLGEQCGGVSYFIDSQALENFSLMPLIRTFQVALSTCAEKTNRKRTVGSR